MALTIHEERTFATQLRTAEALERIAAMLEKYMDMMEKQDASWRELTAKVHGSDSSE